MDKAFFGKLVHFRRAPGGVSTSIVLADVTAKKTRERVRERENVCSLYSGSREGNNGGYDGKEKRAGEH